MDWPQNNIISNKEINRHIEFIKSHMHGLLPVYADEYDILKTYAQNNNLELGLILSIRNQLKIKKAVITSHNIDNNLILKEFEALLKKDQTDVMDFYAKLGYPPHAIIKVIKDPLLKLDMEHQKYFFQVIKDITDIEQRSQKSSAKFEIKIEDYLKEHNIVFKTEKDLRTLGYAITPDILLDSPVTIIVDNIPHEIHWIDAKNFVYLGKKMNYFYQKLRKQAKKYTEAFGRGAFIFRYGMIDNKMDNTLLLTFPIR